MRAEKVKFNTPRGFAPSPAMKGIGTITRHKSGGGDIRVGKRIVDLLIGEGDLSTWTDEELMWGAQRDKLGRKPAFLPKVIPMRVYQELVRRIKTQVMSRFGQEMAQAVETHMAIINGLVWDYRKNDWVPDVLTTPHARLAAIKELYERFLGKAPEHVVIHDEGDEPWKKMIVGSIVGDEQEASRILKEAREREELQARAIDVTPTRNGRKK